MLGLSSIPEDEELKGSSSNNTMMDGNKKLPLALEEGSGSEDDDEDGEGTERDEDEWALGMGT